MDDSLLIPGQVPDTESARKQAAGKRTRVLFAVSEVYPFVKTGGLADVACFLPMALSELGIDIRIVLPAYQSIMAQLTDYRFLEETRLPDLNIRFRLLQTTLPDSEIRVYLVDIPELYDRPGDPYNESSGIEWPDNPARFARFCQVVACIMMHQAGLDWQPEILHCNDWHTGLAPALLSISGTNTPSVFTIHNLAYQGNYSYDIFRSLRLPVRLWSHEALEFFGDMSFIKGGLVYADRLTTVSPEYAREITTPEYGNGMEGLLLHRADRLSGILNGVDYRYWDPRRDPLIKHPYWIDSLGNKTANKTDLQSSLGLARNPDAILLAYIGRLSGQKGIDLILYGLTDLLAEKNVQLVVLGTGEVVYEKQLLAAAGNRSGQMAVTLAYDEGLAHRIQAGADILLMPSRFEPCGLTQLYGLRYGTIPVVCKTGGLADTITDTTEQTLKSHTATGFQFLEPATSGLVKAVRRAITMRRAAGQVWEDLVITAMQQDFNWAKSARDYATVYTELLLARNKD
jgi:starch synthase